VHSFSTQIDHRPWPLPLAPWEWQQAWLDLAFIHFETDASSLGKLLPEGLELELFEGKAWVGIVPFRMEGVTRRGWPAPSLICDFPEINVRTYVTDGQKSGVWFLSLFAPHHAAAWFARQFFKLPYHYATVATPESEGVIHYAAQRGALKFVADYTPGRTALSIPGSFSHWATERYCLYSADRSGGISRAEIHHAKWPLQEAEIEIRHNTLAGGIELGPMHPTVLFSRKIDVVLWSLARIT
jgi:uncharacterized protein YqjF (DUF2071 family)